MDDDATMSPSTAYDRAKANPEEASDAIQTLFDHVESGGTDARSAAGWLESIAEDVPEALEGWTDRFETAIETADDVHVRRKLTVAVNELVEQQAISLNDAGKALTEATRIRDEEHWDDPDSELTVIREGFDGWTEVAAIGKTVPETVIKRSLSIANLGDPYTLFGVVTVLQAAVESESPRTEMAFQGLVDLSTADDQTLTSKATLAVANLVLSGDVPDEDAAREVIAENADVVREKHPIIEEAPEDHPRVKEAREKQQLVEQAREKLSA